MLDEQSTPPAWLPRTHIRLNYARFGDDLVGAIKLRAIELGSKLVTETALDKAKRMEAIAMAISERNRKLTYQASDALKAEWDVLCRLLDEKGAQIQPVLSTAKLEYMRVESGYIIRTTLACLELRLRLDYSASVSLIVARAYVGRLLFPEEAAHQMYLPGDVPECILTDEFYIDYNAAMGWCWRQKNSDGPLLNTTALGELLMKEILRLHESVESGKIVRSSRDYNRRQH